MKKLLLFVSIVLVFSGNSYGQQLWRKVSNPETLKEVLARDSNPIQYEIYALDMNLLKSQLAAAPSRLSKTASNVVVSFPNADGKLQKYRMFEASVMDPELAKRHENIQSYVGKGIDDPTASIRITTTIFGLHTMTLSGNGTSYIDPYTKDLKNYIVYNREGMTSSKSHSCGVKETDSSVNETNGDTSLLRANNSLFKTYRLAMACTFEYAAYHVNAAGLNNGTLAQKKAAVLAAMNVSMARINGVYERDMSLTMVIVPNNEEIIFVRTPEITDDGFTNNTPSVLINESQAKIDAIIGHDNYDIGHTVSTQGGGLATAAVCQTSKARGITGTESPVGDPYDIDFVAHEMGHQFGASHTFNSDQENCDGNRVTTSAFEPGSGTTIMAYAGICSPDNVQLHSDAYFHARSLIQMFTAINGSANCATAVANNNAAPVVSAGGDYRIPFGTPFVLTGSATDADNDALTYCWEQYNFQISEQPPLPGSVLGPNFRSYNPTASPERYFPKMSDILANNLTPIWEVLPNVSRSMAFSLVVRDNGSPLGGQTERATMALVFANVGPFKITSQSSLSTWAKNSSQTVTWDVAGTDANGINTQFVNIKFSTDGGLTFPYTLAENTANDGSEAITVPDALTQTGRIKIEAVGNIYFAINASPILVGYELATVCNTYEFTGGAFAIPDGVNGYTVKTINVPTSGTISDVNVSVNITHPNLQNINIAVVRPGGTTNVLFNQQCAGSENMNVTFDNEAPALTCSSPLNGSFQAPNYNLSLMNGNNRMGDWRIGIKDMVAGGAGTVNSLSLEICAQSIVLAADQFEFSQFALYPNPNNGSFTVQFESASSNKINIAVHDLRGRTIFNQSYNNSGMFSQNLQLDKAQAGIYLVSITDGDKKITKRIIIE